MLRPIYAGIWPPMGILFYFECFVGDPEIEFTLLLEFAVVFTFCVIVICF